MTPDLTHPDLEKDAELRALSKGGDMTPLEILKQARGEVIGEFSGIPLATCATALVYFASREKPSERAEAFALLSHQIKRAGHHPSFLYRDLYDEEDRSIMLAAFDHAIAAAEGGR